MNEVKFLFCNFIFMFIFPFMSPLRKQSSLLNKENNTIKIFYDTLDPDSSEFFNGSFKTFYYSLFWNLVEEQLIKQIVFIPGVLMTYNHTANNTNSTSFKCERGLNECEGNMFHACAIHIFDQRKALKYVMCYFNHITGSGYNNTIASKRCLNSTEYENLERCIAASGEFYMRNLLARKQIIQTKMHSPLITLNDKYDKYMEKEMLAHMDKYICKQYYNWVYDHKNEVVSCQNIKYKFY